MDYTTIPLSQGATCQVSPEDSDLAQLKWYLAHGYAVREIHRRPFKHVVRMHRVILERTLGRALAPGEEPDHADGNSLNNRRDNLRLATHQQNSMNRGRYANNRSGHPGVSWFKANAKWRAQITIDGKIQHLGFFATLEEAVAARERAADTAFGEWRRR